MTISSERTPAPPGHTAPADSSHKFGKVALASMIGTLIEGYDFVLYGIAAALVFPTVFFPSLGATAGAVASFATLGIAFIARPIGAVLFGHFGDKVGRKRMLVATIIVMGAGTTLIGAVPSAASIGVLAPILVVVLRFIQGIALGGEWAGAVLFATEHAPPKSRGLYAMFPQIGHSLPTMFSALSLLAVSTLLSPEDFLDWGWRIPFLVSAGLVIFGLWIRSTVAETPIFEKEMQQHKPAKVPLFESFKTQPWTIIRGAGVPLVAILFIYTGNAFIANYGVDHLGLTRNDVLGATALAGLMYGIFTVTSALVSDRVGRRRIIGGAQILGAAWAVCLFPLLNTGSVGVYYLALSVTYAIAGLTYGAVGAFLPEQFPTRYRYTASGVSYQLGGVLGGGVAPLVAPLIVTGWGSSTFGIILAGLCVLAAACTFSLQDIGNRSMELEPAELADAHPTSIKAA